MSAYAELAVTTNFSFLRGASHPQEMVAAADEFGLAAIGIADRNSFAGVVRAYDEWKKRKKLKLIVGTRLVTVDGFGVLAYPTDRPAYGRLCRLLTQGNLKAKKGECHLTFEEILAVSEGQMFRFALGSQAMSLHMAEALGDRVVLEAPVSAIEQDEDGVTVRTAAGSWRGRYAVVSVPLPLVSRIRFTPDLPFARKAIVDRSFMGSTVKCLMLNRCASP